MGYESFIELDNVTLEDCVDLYEKKGISTTIEDGRIINFVKEWSIILVICGKTASGKDTVVKELVEKHGFHKIPTYTTRPKRKGEKDGITYYFISEEDFKQKVKDRFFTEWKVYNTKFGDWYYGSALEDLKNADDKSVIILTPQGFRDIEYNIRNQEIIPIYLYANNETIKKRLLKRGDNPDEAERRILHDNEDFKGFEKEVNRIVYNNYDDNIDIVINKILQVVKKWVKNWQFILQVRWVV